jgi:hypothetical protein
VSRTSVGPSTPPTEHAALPAPALARPISIVTEAIPRPQKKNSKLIVNDGDYDHSQEKTACHVCRTRSKRVKMSCDQPECGKKFCAPCMRTRCVRCRSAWGVCAHKARRHSFLPDYQEPTFAFIPNATFTCPFCRGNCQCSVCTDRRTRRAAGDDTAGRKKRRDSLDGLLGSPGDGTDFDGSPPRKRPRPRTASTMHRSYAIPEEDDMLDDDDDDYHRSPQPRSHAAVAAVTAVTAKAEARSPPAAAGLRKPPKGLSIWTGPVYAEPAEEDEGCVLQLRLSV